MTGFFTVKRMILILIILLAAGLRLWNLWGVPPSISMDEASIGYNAYAVLHTGGDEYNTFPLISQRSYDDWRRSTYLLLDIPFVAVFGLQPLAVRLPAVILSVLTVWATYFLILALFKKESRFAIGMALLTTFLLAISPWHIYISRIGHESNACLSFLVFGVLFFLQGLRKSWKLFVGLGFLTLSMISYYVGQILIPLLLVGLSIIFRKELLHIFFRDKRLVMPLVLCMLIFFLLLWLVFSPTSLVRFNGTSTFSPSAHEELYTQEVLLHNKAVAQHDFLGVTLHHRYLFPVKVWWSAYTIHFSPSWIFANPSNKDSFKAPYTGLLYLWQFPFVLLGLGIVLFTRILDWKSKSLMLLWFLLAPLPASIAVQVPHANRVYNSVVAWNIFAAFGIGYLLYRLKKIRLLTGGVVGLLVIVGLVQFCKNYFILFPQQQSSSFYYAFSKMMPYVLSHQSQYDHIIFSNRDNMYQSYMGYLWYSKFDPALYQRLGGTISGGYDKVHVIQDYEFRPIDWEKDHELTHTLLVGNITDFPKEIQGKIFTNLDGKSGIMVVER